MTATLRGARARNPVPKLYRGVWQARHGLESSAIPQAFSRPLRPFAGIRDGRRCTAFTLVASLLLILHHKKRGNPATSRQSLTVHLGDRKLT
jgi:hypothetical protein